MSIPKEPRQLMINLMYLVLTAMLALNVSAEIINAFFALDKGNNDSMDIVGSQLDATEKGLDELLADEAKAKYRPIGPAVDDVRAKAKDFITYVSQIRDNLIDEGGNKNGTHDDGDYFESHGKKVPIGKKDKDVTTRILVEEGKGGELETKIVETRNALLTAYATLLNDHGKTFGLKEAEIEGKIESMKRNMTLNISDEWKHSEKKSWADFKFRQMPLAAVLPLLSQIQSNAKSAEATLVNEMAALSGGLVIEFDQFFPMINAKKSYVIKGEPFEAEISVGTYSSQINPSDIQLTVNGKPLKVGADGKAVFKQTATGGGKKTLRLGCSVTNPLTGEVKKGESEFVYEVGRRSATVSADKMNVFYIGVKNPITISAAGVPSAQLKVACKGAKMEGSGAERVITATRQGKAVISLSGGGLAKTDFEFRVKKIPDPVVKLGKQVDGLMRSGEFKAQLGLLPTLENFDFEAKCNIQSYTLYYTRKRDDAVELKGTGNRFTGQVSTVIRQAKPGDQYAFVDVKARCPGDTAARRVNGLTFKIR